MTCTGRGSDTHFFKDCTNPAKKQFREKRLQEIADSKDELEQAKYASALVFHTT